MKCVNTGVKPSPRTPAGAYLNVRRGPRWTSIQVDRWPIADATDEQAATAHDLAEAAARYAVTHGRRGGVGFGGGRVIWSATVLTVDADEALAALFALEADDHEPARALAARYRASTPARATS